MRLATVPCSRYPALSVIGRAEPVVGAPLPALTTLL